jgi:hypothetical protein
LLIGLCLIVAEFAGKLYVFGGTDSNGNDTGTYAYTADGVTWYSQAATMAQRHSATTAIYNGERYLFGGRGRRYEHVEVQ